MRGLWSDARARGRRAPIVAEDRREMRERTRSSGRTLPQVPHALTSVTCRATGLAAARQSEVAARHFQRRRTRCLFFDAGSSLFGKGLRLLRQRSTSLPTLTRQQLEATSGASLREVGFFIAILATVAALVYGPHVVNGGLYYDDWSHASD